MAEFRKLSAWITPIAEKLIETEQELAYIRESDVTIGYLLSDREKRNHSKTVYGECEKVPDKWKWSVPFDFVITLFEPNIEALNGEQIKILLFHELLHVGVEQDGNEERYYIVPHDIEDFKTIINRFGVDWQL